MRSAVVLVVLSQVALAAERDFPLTWTTATLPADANHLEAWLTPHVGRKDGTYVKNDVRLLFSRGVRPSLDTQLSADLDFESLPLPAGTVLTPRVSSVWRYAPYKATGTVGLGALGRLSLGFDAAELELRVIADKLVGPVLFALNASLSRTQFWSASSAARIDTRFDNSLAVRYAIGEHATFGLELRARSAFAAGDYQGTAFSTGPSLSFSFSRFWVAVGGYAQVAADKAPADRGNGEPAELRDNERFVGRFIVGYRTE